ncbi:hypothetical protein GOP47_0012929 [Adiantum capillus-veneris]|uniref:Serine protease EDA2 n=1 Tax=Adiantum capillus-veneris TaxID=13818 RepID=A0A9D4URM6_ADICA|nr:hypothetical protein GOP47_0012323 [Adiantum capillus-veneris]KAI5072823.1 hypothetical protein GOP47_0012929 [Adiantum capillus-veneris]
MNLISARNLFLLVVILSLQTHLGSIIQRLIPLCHASPHTLRHTHYQNIAISRRAAALQASPENPDDIFLSTTPYWLNQTLDHFDPQGSPKFPQRFFEYLGFFKAPHGPIFLTICGESTCPGILNDYIAVLAKRFGAAIVTLEHRYYGFSYPFEDLSTKNLKYLNSKQALSDLATFRNHYQDLINARYHRSSTIADNAWVTFGGSYAGALSAWFRLKFPHLTRGSLASSAIVNAIQDYFAFDQQVAKSIGPKCTQALQAVKANVNHSMRKNATLLKSMFGAELIKNDADFLSLLADSTALAAQYGFQDLLCKPLVKSFDTKKNMLVAYQTYVKNTIYDGFGINPIDYNRDNMKNATLAGPNSGSRLWTYQFCTEFGLLQAAPPTNSLRFSQLSSKYYLDLCSYIFGEETTPNSDATNLYYGGNDIAGSRILFTNGAQDPWRHASKQVSTQSEPVIVVDCQNCAHCVDLSGCPQFPFHPQGDASLCKPRDSIDKARILIEDYINLWITS